MFEISLKWLLAQGNKLSDKSLKYIILVWKVISTGHFHCIWADGPTVYETMNRHPIAHLPRWDKGWLLSVQIQTNVLPASCYVECNIIDFTEWYCNWDNFCVLKLFLKCHIPYENCKIADHALENVYKMSSISLRTPCINTLRPRQNGCHFPDDIFKCIFVNENA